MKLCQRPGLSRLVLAWSLTLAVTVTACKTSEGTKSQENSVLTDRTVQANSALKVLLKKYNDYELQDDPNVPNDCGPFYMPASPDVPYIGTAILYHGFTACPQQYYELAQILAKKGVASFVPLLPGQGRGPVPTIDSPKKIGEQSLAAYYGEFIPGMKGDDWKRYLNFVHDINGFVVTLPGEKFVSGVSVGGALATYSYLAAPGLYKRALISSPFLGAPGPDLIRRSETGVASDLRQKLSDVIYKITGTLVDQLSKDMAFVGALPVGWGDSCLRHQVAENGQLGRRGICHFKVENLAAVAALGAYIVDQSRKPSADGVTPTRVHYVPVEFDISADTFAVRKSISFLTQKWSDKLVSACWFPSNIPHSYFSRFDLADIPDPYWLNSYLVQTSNFIAYGDAFKVKGASIENRFDATANADIASPFDRCDSFPVPDDQISTLR